jgi:hypothetical protein
MSSLDGFDTERHRTSDAEGRTRSHLINPAAE